ncbi:putative molybdopterin-guanine dinucleotide biosynthesis protein B (modular protein) [groundwater metagenome]|uniref:Putative molybdopterin-guanine dinucleotide biosynthesis protein B (Modular protein) n=1 Tax=groundwater metagenome TaxID=717931 RepID=A0A098E802_9ZZZZ
MILGFYGHSNSGKTTLIEKICRNLEKENLKIAVIKHIPHKNFSIDIKTKDTGKFKNLGVDVVAFSPDETAFILGGMNFSDMISKLEHIDSYDVILVEGLKKQNIPKIRVGDCPMESMTIMDYKGLNDLKTILKWIKNEIQKEETVREEKRKPFVRIIQGEKIRTTKLKGMRVRTTKLKGIEIRTTKTMKTK